MTDKEILKAFNKQRKIELNRSVVRPRFMLYKELLQIFIGLIIIFATIYFHSSLSFSIFSSLLCVELIIFFASQTKNILLILIFLYQKVAPAAIRKACLFTPSCSEYMRLSILKYGVFKGVKKGLHRLKKCRPPNGGDDIP